jgi:hypothetical protein
MTAHTPAPAELPTSDLFISWGSEVIPVEAQDVLDALEAAEAITDASELMRLRRRAKQKKQALQFACLDHAWRATPLPLLHRTDPAKPWSYDLVGHLFTMPG